MTINTQLMSVKRPHCFNRNAIKKTLDKKIIYLNKSTKSMRTMNRKADFAKPSDLYQ